MKLSEMNKKKNKKPKHAETKIQFIQGKKKLKECVTAILRTPGKRFAIVAYIGKGAAKDYLGVEGEKNFDGLTVIVNAETASTNAEEVRKIRDAFRKCKSCKIRSCKNLHSKVYWNENVGALIGSANLSSNGFEQETSQIEAAVFMKPTEVPDNLKNYLKSFKAKKLKIIDDRLLNKLTDLNRRKEHYKNFIKFGKRNADITQDDIEEYLKKKRIHFVHFLTTKSHVTNNDKIGDLKLSSSLWFDHPDLYEVQKNFIKKGHVIICKWESESEIESYKILVTGQVFPKKEGSSKTRVFIYEKIGLAKDLKKKFKKWFNGKKEIKEGLKKPRRQNELESIYYQPPTMKALMSGK